MLNGTPGSGRGRGLGRFVFWATKLTAEEIRGMDRSASAVSKELAAGPAGPPQRKENHNVRKADNWN
jgi:hypothetical protein